LSSLIYEYDKHKDKHIVIEASAGTGKTYTIEKMIPQFILGGISIEQIAVLTFTEKAAAELQDRIRKELLNSLKENNADSNKKNLLENSIENLPNASIGTIHHFCRGILKKHSLHLGFSSNFTEIRNAKKEIETYFTKFWNKIEKDDSEELIELIRTIGYSQFKNILIELTEKTGGNKIKLIETPDNSSLEKYLSKLINILDNYNLPEELELIKKFHNSLFKNFYESLKYFLNFTPIFFTDKSTPRVAIRKIIVNSYITETEYDNLIYNILNSFRIKASSEIINSIFNYANEQIEDYNKYLLSQDTITLDGLILNTRKLITEFPEIKKQIQKNLSYLILDECQDTNPIQIDLIMQLFSGLSKGIILVGDPKQSIYRFRQADLNSYREAVDQLTNKKVIPLLVSYRSSKRLIDALNSIFPHFENLSKIYYNVEASREDNNKNKPPLLLLGLDENNSPRTTKETGEDYGAEDLREAATDEIIQAIKHITDNSDYLIEDKHITGDDKKRPIKFSDIAVLANANNSLNKLQKAFSRHSISSSVYKSNLFYSHKVVQAISHLLHSIENPNDSDSLYKTLASDLFLIPESVLYELSEADELTYLFDTNFPEINKIYESLRKAHENRYTKDIAYTLFTVFRENHILDVLSIGFDGKRNLANIYHLAELLSYNQMTENLSFGEIVRNLRNDVKQSAEQDIKLDSDKKDDSFNSIQLMTMHVSKGLEFPVCILFDLAGGKNNSNQKNIFLNDSLLNQSPLPVEVKIKFGKKEKALSPNFENLEAAEENEILQEKDRLLYVALTRARDFLILPLHTLNKLDSESYRKILESAFSKERIEELIESKLAENFTNTVKALTKKEIQTLKVNNFVPPETSPIKLTQLTQADIQRKSGIKVQSYSSITKYKEKEEEYVKEKINSEKKVAPENTDNAPIVISSDKRGTTFGLLCHAVMENFDLKLLSDENKVEKEVIRMVNDYYPPTGLNEVEDYTSQDAINFCVSTLTKSYFMNEEKTKTAKIKDWQYIIREKSFFYKLKSPRMDFLVGIGDGMFYWEDKYYLLDWKTNLIKPEENETIETVIENKVRDSYFNQYMIYSMNLIDNITPKGGDKELFWNIKFGGMLFIFMRTREDNRGSFLIKPTYTELLNFKKDLVK
jgi:ATP-dependent exoDNAse (exonuclease V) beta subunit